MKKAKKNLKGKNKFIRLADENLEFVVNESLRENRSHNNFINSVIFKERIKRYGRKGM